MTGREKLISGMAAAAVLWAGWVYLLPDAPAGAGPLPAAEQAPNMPVISASINSLQLSGHDQRVVELAALPWQQLPFVTRQMDLSGSVEPALRLPVYGGFMRVGEQLIGWLDGRDYSIGEVMIGGEFRVIEFTPVYCWLVELATGDEVKVEMVEND